MSYFLLSSFVHRIHVTRVERSDLGKHGYTIVSFWSLSAHPPECYLYSYGDVSDESGFSPSVRPSVRPFG